MVDIIKFLPSVPTSFPSNIHNLRSKPYYQQIILPKYLSDTNNTSQNDRINNIYTKHWIGNCPTNPPRLLDISNSPYTLHKKIMHQELSRHYPTTVDLSRLAKSKQRQQSNTTKNTTTTITTTTAASGETNLTSQPSFSNDHNQNSRLFDTLSKHVTIKAEPLRPSNSFINSSTNTLTSWQRYWTSTHAQRRRKEANDSEPFLYRPRREQSMPGQTHFVVLRDSPNPNSEQQSNSGTLSIPSNNSINPTKSHISTATTADKEISSTKEDNINKANNQVSTIEFDTSSLIRSLIEISSSKIASKISTNIPLKSTDKEDEKYFREKSLLLLSSSSSHFKSDSEIIAEVAKAQIQTRPITTKVYNFSLPSTRSRTMKKSLSNTITQSKSLEKKETKISSTSQRKPQISTNKKSRNKSQPSTLSTIITTTSISKYSEAKWTEPYVGLRLDPPTPPCSPSLFISIQDSDQEDSDTLLEKSEIF